MDEVTVEWSPDDMLEIELLQYQDFSIVVETLTRIGIASKKNNTLYQSCHILHKRGKYYIVHFKELFALDGKPTNLTESDVERRDTIARLLEQWNLIKIVDPDKMCSKDKPLDQLLSNIKIVKSQDKVEWNLEPKYNIGKPKYAKHY